MTWSLLGLLRRRLTPMRRAGTPMRKDTARRAPRARLLLETLEERTVPSSYSIAANLNPTAIAPGSTLWFSSVVGNVTGVGSAPVTVSITNQTISFTDTLGGTFNLTLPNANLTLTPGGTSATTTYDSTNNVWNTNVPSGLGGNVFLSGYALALPSGLHSGDSVTWSGNFASTASGISLNWTWGAAVYTSFNTSLGSLGVKPCDSNTASSYLNSDKAGAPESYKTKLTAGGTGNGGTNYTGNLTPNKAVTPTYTPTNVSISGTVYRDSDANGVFDSGDVGISGVTMQLSGTTTGGLSVTATTTTNSSGAYSFTTDSNGNPLVAGTYLVTEIEPVGYYQEADNVGTVGGSADGSVIPAPNSPQCKIGNIVLGVGQNGINYNFGEVDPFAQVTPAYPYSSTNAWTDVAFNESQVLAGATVNLATNTLDVWYSDEHALTLGVSTVTVTTASGSTTTNYNVSPLSTDPGSATSPSVGDTATTGTQAATDPSGRPLFPSLYITDITSNASSTSGDWQNGGTAIAPTAVYGAWKPFTITVDQTKSPATVSQTSATDPTANGWNLGSGADPVPASIVGTNAGYGAEIQWSLTSLYQQGTLVTGHDYRFYFIVHDGDQNQSGGDCGQAAFNFTYEGPATVAGKVYSDQNGSGSYTAGDSGVGGVALTLTGTNTKGQSITATTVTAADGTYSFTTDSTGNLLSAGTYQIVETPPAGSLTSGANVGTVNGLADGTASSTTTIGSIALLNGQNGVNYNFGLVQPVSVSGTVYQDIGGTGSYSASDPGIAGVVLTLTGTNGMGQSVTAATTTTANGSYSFTTDSHGNALLPGTYQVTETAPSGYLLGAATVGTVNGAADGSVVSATQIGSITLTTGQAGIQYLFGDLKAVLLSGLVYQDIGGTGAYSASDTGLAGATLTLTGTNGLRNSITATTTTGADGTYSFTTDSNGNALRPGTYVITETVPSGYFTGSDAVGTVNGASDGSIVSTTQIGSIVVTSGQSGVSYLFGNLQPVAVRGLVYQDTNGTGAYNSVSDPGIAGVTLTLTGTNGLGNSITATATTSASGTYSFTTDSNGNPLRPGTYVVTETVPSGYITGAATVGTVNGKPDGSVSSATQISSVGLTSGQAGINYLFGNVKPDSLSGSIYYDINDNGAYDAGDTGMAGVTVTLTGTNNLGQTVSVTTTTSAGGTYSFTTDSSGNPLRPGTYVITETVPSGYITGSATVGTVNGASDGSIVAATQIGSIVVTSGQSGVNYFFGNVQPVGLSGLVYLDTNGTGVYSPSDSGIAGVTMMLTGTNDRGQSVSVSATTGSGGTFGFTTDGSGNLLRPGTYVITETQPSGYLAGATTVGTVNGATDGTVVVPGQVSSITLANGQAGINYLFGDVQAVQLSGLVYQDTDGTGVYSASDPGIAGVTMTLTGTNGMGHAVTATTTTAANGTFSFTTDSNGNALRPGTYQIAETLPSGYIAGTNVVGTVNGAADGTLLGNSAIGSIGLTSGQSGSNYTFGALQPVAISGTAYLDANGSGVYDSGDTGFPAVTLTLTGTNGLGQSVTATTLSAADGTYCFTKDSNGNVLLPGTYQISDTVPTGYVAVSANVGTVSGTLDGHKASPTELSNIAVTSGQGGINYNFGLSLPAAVSGYVYLDDNGTRTLTSGDRIIQDATVQLTGTDINGNAVSLTTTTDNNGYYIFSGLITGRYTVTLLDGTPIFQAEVANVGTVNSNSDGTASSITQIAQVQLIGGNVGVNYNFGGVYYAGLGS